MNKFLTEVLPRGYRDTKIAISNAYNRASEAMETIDRQDHYCNCEYCEIEDYNLSADETEELQTQYTDAKQEAKDLELALKRMERYAEANGVTL